MNIQEGLGCNYLTFRAIFGSDIPIQICSDLRPIQILKLHHKHESILYEITTRKKRQLSGSYSHLVQLWF